MCCLLMRATIVTNVVLLRGILEALGHGAILTYTNLEGVRGVTNEQLEQQAKSLEGATMPNGQKYDDWAQESRRGR